MMAQKFKWLLYANLRHVEPLESAEGVDTPFLKVVDAYTREGRTSKRNRKVW